MNGTSTLLAVLALVAAAAPAAAHDGVRHDLLFTHGRWWDGARFVERDRVWSIGGRLADAPGGPVADTIDLGGRWVLPGFADAHTHHLSDTTRFAPTLRGLLGAGILYAENPNSPASSLAAVRARLAKPGALEMTFAGGGLTSPGGHPVQIYERGGAAGERTMANRAYVEIADRAALDRAWPGVAAGKPDFVKIYLESSELHAQRAGDPAWFGKRGLDPALVPEVVRRASAAGLRVAAHVASAADFRVAVAAGVKEIAHLPLAPLTRADAAAAARAGVTVVTTVVSHRAPPSGVDLDAVHRDNLRLLREAGVRVVLGTDHPTLNVVDEVLALARLGAFRAPELLNLLAVTTPRHVAPDRRLGLSPGDEATFVVLDADPLADLANLRRVAWAKKQGYDVELPPLPVTKPGVADSMAPLIMRGDLAGAFALRDRLQRERPNDLDFGEQQLNGLGYRMLQHGAVAGALAVFRRNAELFPASGNVYDSLADAQIAAGDSAGAEASYRKVLEVLPKNSHYSAEYRGTMEQRAMAFLAARGVRRP